MNDPERTLAIMKDPRSGPMAVTMVVMVLLLKAAALERLIVQHDWLALTLAPILGRTTPLLLFLTTPYVRPQGLGSELARELPHPSCQWVLVLVAGATLGASGIPGIGLLLITVTLFWRLRRSMVRRLGGATGDTTGALVELTECVVLIYSALANNFIF
jgi:adenosylcobinamide-GDP ribazoletransferase